MEERLMNKTLDSSSPAMSALLLVLALLMMLPEASATCFIVGGNIGWTSNVNYTNWAKGKHFYDGDWLSVICSVVYDGNQMDLLEVNKTDYETCNSDRPLHNWTTGHGRDVVPLNVTRDYHIISGKGFCYGGLKLAVSVENPPPPTVAAPAKDGASTLSSGSQILILPVVFTVGPAWDAFIHF